MLRRFIQLSALAMGLASASVTAMERPNILVIWGDDIGFLESLHQQYGHDGLPDAQY